MKKISYLIIGLICVWWGVQIHNQIYTLNMENNNDLAIYLNAFERFPDTWNTVRGSYFLSDHLDPSIFILAPIYKVFGLDGLIFFIPFLVIFLPLWILDKAFRFNWYILLLFGLFLSFHPGTQNSFLAGVFHGNSLMPLGLSLVVYFWKVNLENDNNI